MNRNPQQSRRNFKRLLKQAKRMRSKLRGADGLDRETAHLVKRSIAILHTAAQTGEIRDIHEDDLIFKLRMAVNQYAG